MRFLVFLTAALFLPILGFSQFLESYTIAKTDKAACSFNCLKYRQYNYVDFDGDGIIDVMTNFPTSFYKGLGDGEFERIPLMFDGLNSYDPMYFHDLDADGHMDLLWGVDSYLNDGSQNLVQYNDNINNSASEAAFAGDLFGDARLEVISLKTSPSATLHLTYSTDQLLDRDTVLILGNTDPSSFWMMDLDDDSDLDILYKASGKMGRVMNIGDGQFGPNSLLNSGNNLNFSAVERLDFDNDGLQDLVWRRSNLVGWLKNLGGGNYADSENITSDFTATSTFDPVLMHGCDCDEDGLQELYFYGGSGRMYKLSQNGAGNYTIEQLFIANNIEHIYFEDVDIDGDVDMLLYNGFGFSTSLNESNGFSVPISINSHLPGLSYSRDMPSELVDLTGDGFLDIPIWVHQQWNINYGEHTRAIAKGPLFKEVFALVPATTNREQSGTHFKDFAFGDLNGDGLSEMVVAASHESGYILHQDNSGTFNFNRRQMIPTSDFGKFCNQVKLADLNGDGLLDIVSRYAVTETNFGSAQCNVSYQDTDGTFKREVSGFNASSIFHLVDLDNDGDLDLTYDSWYRANDGNGSFGAILSLNSSVVFTVNINAVGDFNNDGLLDVVYASKYPNTAGIQYCINQGNLVFEPAIDLALPGSGSGQETLSSGDLKGDGFDDIIVDDVVGEKLYIIPSLGDGTFGMPVEIFQGNKCALRGVADWDGDEDLDLFLTSFADATEDSVIVILNDGSGVFTEGDALTPFRLDYEFQLKDVNGDGRMEIVEVDFSDEEDGHDDNDEIQEYVRVHFSGIEIFGCTDPSACNYNVEANNDDGTCCETGCGCTDLLACNYNESASCDDGSCTYPGCSDQTACNYINNAGCDSECFYAYNDCGICDGTEGIVGCMNENACNFNPEATCGGLCTFPGCNDPEACNFYASAGCDGGNCLYQGDVTGHVFLDVNGDGAYTLNNDFNSDIGLFNWQVTIEELGWVGFTNNQGTFYFDNLPYGTYTVSILNAEEGWDASNAISQTIVVDACPNVVVDFLIEPDEYLPYWNMHPIAMNGGMHCFDGLAPGLHVHNLGNTTLNGTITLTFDPSLNVELLNLDVVDPVTIEPGLVIWEVNEDLLPGQSLNYRVRLEGPGPEFLGQSFPMQLTLSLFNDELGEYAFEAWQNTPVLTCSYDPNDKYTEYPGYTDEHHFVNADDDLIYYIRFQNIGNAPANDIVIVDSLDIEMLDISTFMPIMGSHDHTTTIDTEGVVHFQFLNINLPDSTCCGTDSQGFVAFSIRPKEDVVGGDVIYNEASIYFDANPPIITNTTWHTIFDCPDSLAEFASSLDMICEG
ncbi:MAG: VCBS repeat-containing protein, partial [Flavobacteriales bacterium]|nr:VCBS repeat-containing protein [Flavobacteriales bacterium]